ncbi:non-ribosomal peptide synthetase [Tenacibaculum agarivorans]|uniref:non-ribosomal peptide synthetase n=1 Tax=Tenacibaculum agarivorans TaxID=1908389 RepID=UPI0009F972D7|nr:non-ribosomal peptide synthetase [Tenacibaculum agarivorans]
MDIISFFHRLDKEGIKLVLKNDSLKIQAKTEIKPEIIKELKSNKQLIIDHLKAYEDEGAADGQQLQKITAYNKESLDRIPLSFNQERLWFLDQLNGSNEYHMPTVIRLEGALNITVLEEVLQTIVSRHEVLRTNILSDEGLGYQEIMEADSWSLDLVEGVSEESLTESLVNYINAPFNVATDYKLRSCLYDLGNEKYVLACVFHHIASDGWSKGILVNEFIALYSALQAGKEIELPELTLQYSDYAIWQRKHIEGEILDNQLAYWEKKLKDISTLTLPINYKRTTVTSKEGANVILNLDQKLRDDLQAVCKKEGVTLFMLLLSVFKVLLSRYSGQEDICVGTPVANRTQADLEGMIGFFVNTLVLRSDVSGNPSFRELLNRIKSTTLEGYDNQLVPFEKVVDKVLVDRDMSTTPLFQVMFALQNTSSSSLIAEEGTAVDLGGVEISGYSFEGKTSKFDLTLDISENDLGIVMDMEYRTALFDKAAIEQLLAHYKNLLLAIVDNITQPIAALPILNPEEETQLLEVFNDTSFEYTKGLTIVDLFKEQVVKTPEAYALSYKGDTLTYKELDACSNQLAHYLVSKGVKTNSSVGILFDRSFDMVISMLGVLKAGCYYVPIDASLPSNRLSHILQDAEICYVLYTEDYLLPKVPVSNDITTLLLKDAQVYETSEKVVDRSEQSIAYVMYTSGTTGVPKGICITDTNIITLVNNPSSAIAIRNSDRVLQWSNYAFDGSTYEIFGTLLNGATLYFIDSEVASDAQALSQVIHKEELSVIFITTALFNSLAEYNLSLLSSLRLLLFGGEKVSVAPVRKMLVGLGAEKILHVYGPTETTTYASCEVISEIKTNVITIPIGKPLSNTKFYVLDQYQNVLPIGAIGELCISGSGVAKGYLNREELTNQKFIENPFVKEERLYKTGDLVRWLPEGKIEFVGRKDTQVKIRGYRIELGEIENALSKLTAIHQSCVLVKEDTNGNKRLVGYVVTDGEFDKKVIQSELKESIPEYMIPGIWIELEELPLTSNGKLDKKSLPEPNIAYLSTAEYIAPRNNTEKQLAIVWQELLGVEKIGIHDNFFELGGHSLLVIQLIAQLQKIDFYIQVKDIFSNSTIASLSEKVSSEAPLYEVPANGITTATERILPKMLPLVELTQEEIDKIVGEISGGVANIQDIYPLSPLQEGMYFHYLMSDKSEGDPYVLSNLLVFVDKEKRTSFVEALEFVMNRHDVLRTCVLSDGLPSAVQVVLREVKLSVEHLVFDESKDVLSELKVLSAPGGQWMDVSKAPLMHLKSADDEEQEYYFLWITHHHVLFDHVGLEKIIEEIASYTSGETANLPEPVLYREFIAHTLHLQATNDSASYFKELLGEISEPTYPFDVSDVQGSGNNVKESIINISEELSAKIRSVSTTLGISPGVLFHAAYAIVVGRCSNKEYALFGSLLSGRLQGSTGAADSLGLFINTLPFFIRLEGSVKEYILAVKNALGSLLSYEQTPLASVQGWSGVANDMPLFSALLNFRHSPEATEEEINEDTVDLGFNLIEAHERTNYPFSLDVDDYGMGFGLKAQVDERLNADHLLAHTIAAITGLVEGVENESNVAQITILSEEEETQILEDFNANKVAYRLDKTVVNLFEEQAEKNPDAIALVFEEAIVTYKELDERSNQLAHYLVALGVQEDDLIGVCLERGFEMIIAILGILKSGGAYVPMKPDFPKDRISSILEDTACHLLITDIASKSALATFTTVNLIVVDDISLFESEYPVTSLDISYNPNALAYVIYTSGSTGVPKGAMIEHAGLLNHSLIMIDELKMTNESVIAFTAPFTFDISVWQMLSGLLCGGCVAIYNEDMILNIDEFQASLFENKVSHLQLVPSYVSTLLDTENTAEGLSNLAYFLVTGEAATKSLLDKWFSLYPSIPVVNAYGPAEAADDITLHIMEESPNGIVVPIGKPVANMELYVVDQSDNLCPIGVVGELWTSGVGVGRGYLNREELTKEKFITNPFKPEGGRLYKTGDLGRWLPDGTLEFVGRSDDQVKIRGYRIELGEIENALSVVSGVQQSCVLAKKDTNGINHLVGYVVVEGELDKELIQEELKASLPDYMVPIIWIALEEMPLTANGKLDKKALPELDGAMLSTKAYVAPRNEKEEKVAAIWEKLFNVAEVGVHDSFFELGGNSLLVIKLISKLQNIGFNIGVRDVFSNPTVAGISDNLLSAASIYQVPPNGITVDTTHIVPEMVPLVDFEQEDLDKVIANIEGGVSNIEDMYPLSPLQEGIYFHHLMSTKEEGDPYVLPHILSFSDKEKRTLFIDTLQFIVNRHDVLRTSVLSEGLPKAVQVVHREAQLSLEELVIDEVDDVLSELKRLHAPGTLWMDVSQPPLMKLKFVDDLKNDNYYLVLLEHHLMFDHIGVEKVVSEVEMCLLGKQAKLPEPVLYRDFIGHVLHLQATNDSELYFKNLYTDIEEPTYPYDLLDVRGSGLAIEESDIILSEELSKELREVSTKLRMSPAVLFHAAYGLVVGKCSNKEYAIFGSLFSGRLQGSLGVEDSLGMFINTLPFLVQLKGSISEYVHSVKEHLNGLLAYEQTPLSSIQSWTEIPNEAPMFSALLNFRHANLSESEEGITEPIDLGVTLLSSEERTNYPFTLSVDDYGDVFGLIAQIHESVPADRIISYMQEALEQLLEGLQSEQKELTDIVIASEKETKQLLTTFNATQQDYILDKTVVDVFEEQVQQSPTAIAVCFEGKTITYKELDQRANQVAHYLREKGIQPDAFVGICMDRSLELIVAILGVLKSGGAYIPIDPTYPEDRINYMLTDAGINLVLSSTNSSEVITKKEGQTIVCLDSNWATIAKYPKTRLSNVIQPNNLAYVIYTSGSTGKPKGVLVEHQNLLHLCYWHQAAFSVTSTSRGTLFAGVGFDASVWELFPYLLIGASIYPIAGENRYDLQWLSQFLNDNEITHAYIPTLLCEHFIDAEVSLPNTTILTGGDALSLPKQTALNIYNNYGPTEGTVVATSCKLIPENLINEKPSIGKPIDNTQVYIVDSAMNLSPMGVVGELCIGGSGVARGYLNREELTNEKFINNPFVVGDRLYKTGDLARWLPNGNIEFIGRKDAQVKIRGYRIELGEIENALSNLSSISQSCVLAKEDTKGNKHLVGYVVTENDFNKEATQAALKESLPDYMVPSIWVKLEEMPLTSNGKLNRKALPEPETSALSTQNYVAPRNETEAQIVAIWQEILGVEKVGIYDDFFELGGHSLLIVQLISRLQKISFYIEIKEIFTGATVAEIGEKLATENFVYKVPANGITLETDYITPEMLPLLADFTQENIDTIVTQVNGGVANIQDIYPLSPLQEGMYFHHLMSDKEEGDPYVLPNLLSFPSLEKRSLFIEALQFVVNRHDVLRTCILSKGLPQAVQVVVRKAALSVEKLAINPTADIQSELKRLIAPGSNWVDVSKAPILELKSADDIANDQYYLFVNQHHMVFDHVGLEIILSEIVTYISGQVETLQTPVLYRDFIGHVLHLQNENSSEQYFKELLGNIDESTYPFGLSNVQGNGTAVKAANIALPDDVTKKIRKVSVDLGISPAVLFHAAYGLVVGKCSNKEYAIFGSLFSGRLQGTLGAADSLGLFINTLPFLVEFKGSTLAYVQQVKERLGALLPYEQTPLSRVHGWSGISNEVPLFSALLNFRHSHIETELKTENDEELIDLEMEVISGEEQTNYPFSMDVDDYGIGFGLKVQVDGSISADSILSYMVEAITGLLAGIENGVNVANLEIVPAEEKTLVLKDFNAAEADYPLDKTVIDLFTVQVEKNPNATAAIFEETTISYKELDQCSNQLAHCLVKQGIQQDDLVGICLERGLDMLVGVLGILKSGAAYVPMKPDFPADRISHILEDTKCKILVTDTSSKSVATSFEIVNVITIDDNSLIDYPVTELAISYNPSALAYVIYTSGSTGVPKGAMIEHAGLLNHLLIMVDELKMTNESVVAFTAPFTFDISVWQLLSGLLSGGCIAIYSEDQILQIDDFQTSLFENKVSHLQLVPSYVSSLIESGKVVKGLSNLTYFLVTGEATTKSLLDKWFSLYPEIPVVNAYGPAEAADDITLHIMHESPNGAVVPIGKPVANMDVYVVDQFNNLCPIGVVGELWTSGIGVGRGYLNREELTEEKFIANPFTEKEERLYKTGDLGRWLPDGTLEFVGRSDDQVKIRGYRIELGEIENALSVVSGIQNSCVLAKKDTNNIYRLVGYVVVENTFDKEFIQKELKQRLPDYMIPMIWVELEEMPLTANGKLDKKALPEPDKSALTTKVYVAPRTENEEKIAIVWEKLFGMQVGIYDNFFELGGNSLLVIKLISNLQHVGFNVGVKQVFSNPTVAGISENLLTSSSIYQVPPNGITTDTTRIIPEMVPLVDFEQEDLDKIAANIEGGVSNIEDIYPLSPLQGGIYFHHLMSNKEVGDPYVLSHLLSFSNTERRVAFVDALQYIVNRHDILRTCALSEGLPSAVQVVLRKAELFVEHLELDPAKDVMAELERLTEPGTLWMDVTKPPLMRLQAVDDVENDNYYLILLEHHLMFDHIGVEKVVAEVEMCLLGQYDRLPEPVLYRNFIGHTLHQQATNDSEAYFKNLYGDIEEPTHPFELSDVRGEGTEIKEAEIVLPTAFSKQLREVSTKLGMTPAVLFHAAYGIVVGKCSNKDYAIFGSLFSGRLQGSIGVEGSLGMFINTLPFLVEFTGSIAEYVNAVKDHLSGLLPYEQTPLSSIQGWSNISNDVPLFSALLNFRHTYDSSMKAEVEENEIIDLGISVLDSKERSNYPFTISVDDFGVDFGLTAQIDERIDASRVLGYMQETLEELLKGLQSDKEISVTSLRMLGKEETALLETFNATSITYPEHETVVSLFADQVDKVPENTAVVYEDVVLSYRELDELSNQLAHYVLANYKLDAEHPVGVVLERSDWLIVSYLAILKTGSCYVPIDTAYPEERKEYIIADSGSSLIIDNLFLETFKQNREKYTTQTPEVTVQSNDLAYIIYTSGSTGKPKGVLIEHGNLAHLCFWHQSEYEVTKSSKGSLFAGIGFDASVWEIYPYLISGASLYPVSENIRYDLNLFSTFLNTNAITHAYIPTLLCERFVEEDISLPNTTILTGGDALKLTKATNLTIYNNYGPTETTVVATSCQVTPSNSAISKPPIGKPIHNAQIYILNETNELLPVGIVGELCIGGKGVGRGYLNNEELTNEKFIDNPFKAGDRIYKTGDLAKWLPDGNIEFIGRKDYQVKIRGYRIELGEIEAALSNIPAIQQCCVLAKEDEKGNNRLVSYVVVSENFNKEQIQTNLKESLPDYMVPNVWITLEEMPLTASGKLDRKALPEPDITSLSSKVYVAPKTEIEKQLVTVWEQLLGVDKIGLNDDFFELGGHSLLVVQMISRLQKLGYHIEVKDIFTDATVVGISKKLASGTSIYKVPANGITEGIDRIVPEMLPLLDGFTQEHIDTIVDQVQGGVANIQDMYPLSPLQEGIYFHHLMSDKTQGDPYVLPNLLSFANQEKRTLFIEALQFVVNRHDVLRTLVLSEGLPNAVQIVVKEAQLAIETLTFEPSVEIASELQGLIGPGKNWMDLSKAPTLELKIADDPTNGNYYLIVNQHHLIFDHVGLEMVISEIVTYVSGNASNLPEPVLYRDFIGHVMHLQTDNNSEIYFKELLEDIQEPSYPFELSSIRGNNSVIKDAEIILSEEITKEIREVSVQLGISPAVLFHAAYGVIVARCSGKEYAVFGSLFSGRLQGSLGAADSLGLFINTLPFLVELKGNVLAYIQEVKQRLADLLAHEQTPLAKVHSWSGIANDVPLFSALFNFRHSHIPTEEEVENPNGIDLEMEVMSGDERTNYPFGLYVDDYGFGFGLTVQVDETIDPNRVLGYMQETITELLEAVKSEKEVAVSSIAMVSEEEKLELLETFNTADVNYPKDKTLVDLFTEQVQKTPNAIAVVYEGVEITYKELDKKSNQLARYLREKGVQPDTLVGICIDRSLEMLVGILGILKSGGAYVPVDPDYPQDRIDYILNDANINLVISNEASQKVLKETKSLTIVLLDTDWSVITEFSTRKLSKVITPGNLAYVIYTSGSTGKPKGVLIEHINVVRLFENDAALYDFGSEDVWTLFHSFCFDFSVWEMYGALLFGGRLVVVPKRVTKDMTSFTELLVNEGVTVLNQTPSSFYTLQEEFLSSNRNSAIRYVIFGGEALNPTYLKGWKETYPDCKLINMYGITETTVHVTYKEITATEIANPVSTIGTAIPTLSCYIVDNYMNLVPQGVIGELCVGGAGVARGYLNRQELTDERFVSNPFNNNEEARLYKSGDLGRWLPDGTIEYIGRKDHQVKIRGYRIELGEIESTLLAVDTVHHCCVLAKEDASGTNRLIGYVVVEGELDKEVLQEKLRESLPEYMIPMIWVALDTIPLTSNGKLDRKALPEPDGTLLSTREYVAPRNEIEEQLVAIWQELLGVDKIGVYDNFFELGGHSLLATRLVSMVNKALDIKIEIVDIFEFDCIEQLANYIGVISLNKIEDEDEYVTTISL